MKRLWMLAILMLVLAGCGGSAAPNGWQCKKGLCVKIEVVEPIRWGESIGVSITVSSERDIRGLGISLTSYPPSQITFEKAEFVTEGGVRWATDIQAKIPQHFVLSVRFPREGIYSLFARAYDPTIGMVVTDGVSIYLTREGKGEVYHSGTPIPVTPWPLPVYTITPGPSPTLLPTSTPIPSLPLTPTHIRSPLATPTQLPYPFISPISTPTPVAYPFVSPLPTPTPVAYP